MNRFSITVGLDLGDKTHSVCAIDEQGKKVHEARVSATREGLERLIGRLGPCRVALEAGTHSPWVSRVLDGLGCEVLVANPRRTRAIWDRVDKSDGSDAEMLGRLARVDPQLLRPIYHRSQQTQAHLSLLKSRSALVEARTGLICHARGLVKAFGARLPKCDANGFARHAMPCVPEPLRPALEPMLRTIAQLTETIKQYEAAIEQLARKKYPQTAYLQSVSGVGPLTSLAFVLRIEAPGRFAKSRSVGPYLGLTPRRDQSGDTDKQLHITKAGDGLLRWMLVQCAHKILGPHGIDSDLRRAGMRQMERGGKNARKRAIVAVARKLAVVLHRLWAEKTMYEPFAQERRARKAAAA